MIINISVLSPANEIYGEIIIVIISRIILMFWNYLIDKKTMKAGAPVVENILLHKI